MKTMFDENAFNSIFLSHRSHSTNFKEKYKNCSHRCRNSKLFHSFAHKRPSTKQVWDTTYNEHTRLDGTITPVCFAVQPAIQLRIWRERILVCYSMENLICPNTAYIFPAKRCVMDAAIASSDVADKSMINIFIERIRIVWVCLASLRRKRKKTLLVQLQQHDDEIVVPIILFIRLKWNADCFGYSGAENMHWRTSLLLLSTRGQKYPIYGDSDACRARVLRTYRHNTSCIVAGGDCQHCFGWLYTIWYDSIRWKLKSMTCERWRRPTTTTTTTITPTSQ